MNWKRIVAMVVVSALAITTGLIAGNAIKADRKSVALAAFREDVKIELPSREGKTPQDFNAFVNFHFAKQDMLAAKTVEVTSLGKVKGTAMGQTQEQEARATKKFDGRYTYIESTSKTTKAVDFPGVDSKVNVGAQAYFDMKEGNSTVYTRKRVESDTYAGDWKAEQLGVYQERFGYHPRNYIPFLVSEDTVDGEIPETLFEDGCYTLQLNLLPAAAENYRRHVTEMSGSAPTYTKLSLKMIIDENWTIRRIEIHEEYEVVQFKVFTAKVVSDTVETYRINEKVVITEEERP